VSLQTPTRVLFVDDEPSLRATLPEILKLHGFDVRVAGSVADALAAISSQEFDVLISDLNIGQPGDGFTVVSAMRRTQPNCITFILTGFPAFETALEAIRAQVDDYLVKPAEAAQLVNAIEQKLKGRRAHEPIRVKRLAVLLRDKSDEIAGRVVRKLREKPHIQAAGLSDEQLLDSVPKLLGEIADQLDSSAPEETPPRALRYGARHGEQRGRLGYSPTMLLDDADALDSVIFEIVQEHLLSLDTSYLIPDLRRLNRSLREQVQESLRALLQTRDAAA
jgi:ActR/RegA family two-component response regulator